MAFSLLVLLVAAAALVLVPGASMVSLESGGATIEFSADRRTVFAPGDCVLVSWQVEGVREVYLDDEPVIGQGTARSCLQEQTRPTLRVVLPDGAVQEYALPISYFIEQPSTLFLAFLGTALLVTALLIVMLPAPMEVSDVDTAKTIAAHARTTRIARGLQMVGAFTLSLALIAIGLELLLRLFFGVFGSQAQRISYLYTEDEIAALDPYIIALPLIEYGLSPDREGHNALGYRGAEIAVPKPAGVLRIVAMGGSTTYGFTPVDESYPAWLERTLREQYGYAWVEVLNAGVHGYTTWNTFVNFALRIVELQPDLVIIYHAGNDVLPREVSPDCYRGVNPLLGLDPRGAVFADINQGTLSRSVLYRFLAINLGIEGDPGQLASTQTRARVECDSGGEKAANVAANRPIYFERNLVNLIAVARMHEIPLLFSTWAFQQDSADALDYWRVAVAEHNDILRRLATEYDVPLIDYAPLAPQEASYWSDYVHMNSAGSRHQAEAFAAFIVESNLLDRSADRVGQ